MTESWMMMLAHGLGGIGIFLLAISMLTQGLQMISGHALQRMLVRWTRTPFQGLLLGGATTAFLQSSSAVTAIVIGLVNAAVLPLNHAIWVVFGANVGTTMTSWLVSLSGFDFNLKAFALPFIGVGMLMKTFLTRWQWNAAGTALAGFGLFFIGVDILKDAFSLYTLDTDFQSVGQAGFFSLLALIGAGFVMSVVTQSSSAAIALILTGTAGGMLDLSGGAAMIIGASLGTTSTAVIAVIGASPNAKRTAAAHVIFNVLVAAVAVLVLPFLLQAVALLESLLGIVPTVVVSLAMFHTLYKLMGVAIIWPLVPRLTRMLEGMFAHDGERTARPQFLDQTTLGIPTMAMGALMKELHRFKVLACRNALEAFHAPLSGRFDREHKLRREALAALSEKISAFAGEISREKTDSETTSGLHAALRINRYLQQMSSLSDNVGDLRTLIPQMVGAPESARHVQRFIDRCSGILDDIAADRPMPRSAIVTLVRHYHQVKDDVLQAGAEKTLPIPVLSAVLEHLSLIRRMTEQAIKAGRYLSALEGGRWRARQDSNLRPLASETNTLSS